MDVLLSRSEDGISHEPCPVLRGASASPIDLAIADRSPRSSPQPARIEEYSLVPPPVHPVDIDRQPATQLPPYSVARKKTQLESRARQLDPGMLKRALAAIAHTTGTDACDSVFSPRHPRAMGSRPQHPSQLGCSARVVHLPSWC